MQLLKLPYLPDRLLIAIILIISTPILAVEAFLPEDFTVEALLAAPVLLCSLLRSDRLQTALYGTLLGYLTVGAFLHDGQLHAEPSIDHMISALAVIAVGILGLAIKYKQRQLRQAQAAAERALRAREIFLGHVSHEFRTPLNAIQGFAEMMQAETFGPVGNDTYRDYAGFIVTAASRLTRHVDDILELSSRSMIRPHLEATEVESFLAMMVGEWRQRTPDACAVSVVGGGKMPPAAVAGERLSAVLFRLLDDAVAHGATQFEIQVATAGLDELRLRLRHDGRVSRGIEEADPLLSDPARGLGLSMPICRKLLEECGARLELGAERNGQRIVTISLPVWRESTLAAEFWAPAS